MVSDEPRITAQTLKVLGALLDSAGKELSGAEIGRDIKLLSGSLYPILMRLEDAKWVTSRWEDSDPRVLGHPRRRFYRLTSSGARQARTAFENLLPKRGRLAWA
jgi:DNA-binding PadR family transcriptional regulator